MVDILVFNKPLVYNAILGRPTLNELKVMISIYHLVMKFLTHNGVKIFRGKQEKARKCYVESVNKVCHKVPQPAVVATIFKINEIDTPNVEVVNKICHKVSQPAVVTTIFKNDEIDRPKGEIKPLSNLDPHMSEEETRGQPIEDLVSYHLDIE